MENTKTGVELIAEERKRQIELEGWAPEYDQSHTEGELANAGALYALTEDMRNFIDIKWGNDQWLNLWSFDMKWLKFTPEDRIKQLCKAGALIAAEIDRLITVEIQNSPSPLDVIKSINEKLSLFLSDEDLTDKKLREASESLLPNIQSECAKILLQNT